MNNRIKEILSRVVHPETGQDIISMGLVEGIKKDPQNISVSLKFRKKRDPFRKSIERAIRDSLSKEFSMLPDDIIINYTAEDPDASSGEVKASSLSGISKIIGIASGKGGVGKSTVTANLAVALSSAGYSVGILDADIYGPSQPVMFGIEDFRPSMRNINGEELIEPGEAFGIKIMSIGFFINPGDALVWRGPMATSALKQLIQQTDWGNLDYLLVDLPPGTGDVHLTVLGEISLDGVIIVTTPQQLAIADVRRGLEMFRGENVAVPVIGIVENMAWFTPAELPDNRYHIFGREGAHNLSEETGVPIIGQIPIIISVMEGSDSGKPQSIEDKVIRGYYQDIAEVVEKRLEK